MERHDYPILEFDPDTDAVLNPEPFDVDLPEVGVICFFNDVIERVCRDARRAYELESEFGNRWIYDLEVEPGRRLAVFHPGVGPSMAAAAMEEAFACGVRKFVSCGACGVLDPALALGHVIIGNSAIRDEGTSYHYLPPSREVAVDASLLEVAARVLEHRGVPHVKGKVWTTAAGFRETPRRVQRRRSEGALIVEMEAAAFLAVAQFRGCAFLPLFYAGDVVVAGQYDSRGWEWANDHRQALFDVAAAVALAL